MNLNIKKVSRSQSLSSEVAEKLQALLDSGEIKVGEKLPSEHKLCDLFGVSRTVIREAISQLKSIGLIDTKRGFGNIVLEKKMSTLAYEIQPNDLQSVLHILELRMSVETMAAEFAAQRHNEQDLKNLKDCLDSFEKAANSGASTHHEDFSFHLAIATASKNPFYQQLYHQLNQDAIPRMRALGPNKDTKTTADYLERIHNEHLAIYSAIEARDANTARSAMHRHLQRAYNLYSTIL